MAHRLYPRLSWCPFSTRKVEVERDLRVFYCPYCDRALDAAPLKGTTESTKDHWYCTVIYHTEFKNPKS